MRDSDQIIFFDIETTGFNPIKEKITTIQVRTNGKTTIWKEWEKGEVGIIEEFYNFTLPLYRMKTKFVGYNILKFDIPFISERLHVLDMKNREEIFEMINRNLGYIDMYQFLGDNWGKFVKWKLGLTGKSYDTTNAEMKEAYAKKDYDKIIGYVEDEMIGQEKVFEALRKEPFYQELQKLRHDLDIDWKTFRCF